MPFIRKSQFAALLFVAVFCLNGMHAVADTITTFTATGAFQDGAVLSRTIDINITNGQVLSANLTASAPQSMTFTSVQAQEANYPITGGLTIFIGTNAAIFPTLNLGFGTDSLIGYTGGNLNSQATPFKIFYMSTIQFSIENYDLLISGSLTPATAMAPTPEPFSLVSNRQFNSSALC